MSAGWLLVFTLAVSPLTGEGDAPGDAAAQEQAPQASPSPSPSPEPEAAPAEAGSTDDTTILDKIGTFRDIEDLDISSLLAVSSEGGGALTLDDAPSVVTLVTEEDIRRTGAQNLLEVLETLPGFDVVVDATGRSRIAVRGALSPTGSPGVVFLINGQRLNEEIGGGITSIYQRIAVDNVKRIEISRGPGSVRVGPNAVHAVVNVVTEGVESFRRTDLAVGGGSFGEFLYNFRYGFTFKKVSFAGFVQFARVGAAGLEVPRDVQSQRDAAFAGLGTPTFHFIPASLAPGPTVDDGRSVDAYFAATYGKFSFGLRRKEESGGVSIGNMDALSDEDGQLSAKQMSIDVTYKNTLTAGNLRLSGIFTQTKRSEFFEPFPANFTTLGVPSASLHYPAITIPIPPGLPVRFDGGLVQLDKYNTNRYGLEGSLDRHIGPRHAFGVGGALEHEATGDLDMATNFDPFTHQPFVQNQGREDRLQELHDLVPDEGRTLASLWVEDTWSAAPRVAVIGGLRLEQVSDFDATLLPRVGIVGRLPRSVNLKLDYARGRRVPSLGEMFYTTPAVEANPDLPATTNDTIELQALYHARPLRASLTVFGGWLRDVVALEATGRAIPWRTTVTEGTDLRGIELEVSRDIGNNSLRGRYTFQSATDVATDLRAADVPRHMLHIGGYFGLGPHVTLTPSLRVVGQRERAPGDPRAPLDGYALVNLDFQFQKFHKAMEAVAGIHNLFDTDYHDPSPAGGVPGDYPRPGITFYVKLRYALGL